MPRKRGVATLSADMFLHFLEQLVKSVSQQLGLSTIHPPSNSNTTVNNRFKNGLGALKPTKPRGNPKETQEKNEKSLEGKPKKNPVF